LLVVGLVIDASDWLRHGHTNWSMLLIFCAALAIGLKSLRKKLRQGA
jgi:hypothetical protein